MVAETKKIADKKSLTKYRKRRNFTATPEPSGKIAKKKSAKKNIFVVQLHDASHLHYDFRLEIDGVLKSWAVPKGPSMDPAIKHLAVETEDHPIEYATFEGVIPEGNYGAGPVMVWDTGTFENIKMINGKLISLDKSYELGTIEVILKGTKLKGAFALIQMKQRDKQWLLIKMHDEYAKPKSNVLKSKTRSALTGRTLKQIASDSK